ncbi:MAG: hypothetical protein M3Y59_07320 [Myxococcota bacterium]|nr:hypothetical protein [Myxococcota bacterium]
MRRLWMLSLLTLGCATSAVKPAQPTAAMTDVEQQVLDHVLPGCARAPSSTSREQVFYCPDQAVFFAVQDSSETSPDVVFNAWIEEFNQRAQGELEVLERSQAMTFGPSFTALYVKLRTPQMPEDGYLDGYVALTNVNGQARRVWCSATGAEPMGRLRCERDLPGVALIDPP